MSDVPGWWAGVKLSCTKCGSSDPCKCWVHLECEKCGAKHTVERFPEAGDLDFIMTLCPACGVDIPKKAYFRIGEAATILNELPHVLRYWETQFAKWVRPERSKRGQRVYSRRTLENLRTIKHLLRVKRYTILGAIREMDNGTNGGK